MENYIVSARKYRPATFASVVGQGSLTVTLKNAIQNGKLAHAYLFCGPRGVGKTTCARIFAKTINCTHLQPDGEACDECESCRLFREQRSFNIHELDAASNNGVDEIRSLIEEVRIPPQMGKYKVFIIDEVHMLSQAAFNAFLKTLEEPPHHAIFILATTEKHKILPTILSRCQIYDFNRMSVADTVRHLQYVAQQEGVTADAEALNVIAQKADGGMRDALSIFDQVVSFTHGHLTYERVIENLNVLDYDYYFWLVDDFLANKVAETMVIFNDILNKGFQGDHFIVGLGQHLRDLLVSRDAVTLPLLEVSEQVRQRYQEQAQRCNPKFLYGALRICNDCDLNYRASKNKRLLVELALIQCAQLTEAAEVPAGGLRPTNALLPIFSKLPAAGVQPVSSVAGQSASPQSAPSGAARPVAATSNLQPAKADGSNPSLAGSPNSSLAGGSNSFLAGGSNSSLAGGSNSSLAGGSNGQSVTGTSGNGTPAAGMPSLSLEGIRLTGRKPISITRHFQEAAARAAAAQQQQAQAQAQSESSTEISQKPSEPLTDDRLRFLWMEFMQILPDEDAAARGRMELLVPKLIGEDVFEVMVDNIRVSEDMNQIRPRIEAHMRRQLSNPRITMKLRVAERGEFKRILSPLERFRKMCDTYPGVRMLQEELRLQIR